MNKYIYIFEIQTGFKSLPVILFNSICILDRRFRPSCWHRRSTVGTGPFFALVTILGFKASIRQRFAVVARRVHGLPGLPQGLVDPQLHLALPQLGCSSVVGLGGLGGQGGFFLTSYNCIFHRFWRKRVIQSSGLSQESSSCLRDDGPVPEDVVCSRELRGHHESDDVFVAYGYRDEVDLLRVGQSSQELFGQSISCLE